jgi:hypothetical protein
MFLLGTGSAWATLVGTQVAGGLYFGGGAQNSFDPAQSRFVPAGYLNTNGITVTISSNAVEYGYSDGTVLLTADFTGTQLIVTDHVMLTGAHYNAIELVFSNTAFSSLSKAADSFPYSGMTSSLSGNVITLDWAGGSLTSGQTLQAVFNVNAPASPLLSIQPVAPNAVVVSWPGPSTDFRLQQNSGLAPANWVDVTNTPVFTNGQNQVTVSPTVGSQYFRLIYP